MMTHMLDIIKRSTTLNMKPVDSETGFTTNMLKGLKGIADNNDMHFSYNGDGMFAMSRCSIVDKDTMESIERKVKDICRRLKIEVEVVYYRDSTSGYYYEEFDEDYEDRFNNDNRRVINNPVYLDADEIRENYYLRYVGLIDVKYDGKEIIGGRVKYVASDYEYVSKLEKDGIIEYAVFVANPPKKYSIQCYDASVYGDGPLTQEKIEEILKGDKDEREKKGV